MGARELELEDASMKGKRRQMQDWVVWQLIDSAFPSGGFVHSGGVEATSHLGFINGKSAFEKYLQTQLTQTMNTAMVYMLNVYSNINKNSPFTENLRILADADSVVHANATNHVANRASRAQGQALLATASLSFPDSGLSKYKSSLTTMYGHYAPIFGLVCKLLGIEINTTKRMFLFVTLRGLLSSAVRLNITGPLEAQTIQHKYSPLIDQLLASDTCHKTDMSETYQTAPLLDILHGAHDRLYSRLFNT
jgi:urease accessory protein